MLSLIVSIMSVVLVSVLALATLYYGGSIWTSAATEAKAAAILNQGEQLVAAAKLYRVDHGYPVSNLNDLVIEGYLSGLPVPMVATASGGFISAAYAANGTWTWDAEKQVLALVQEVHDKDLCAQLNHESFSVKDVVDAVDTQLRVQCYGSTAPYTVVWNAYVGDLSLTSAAATNLCDATAKFGVVPGECGAGTVVPLVTAAATPEPPAPAPAPVLQPLNLPGLIFSTNGTSSLSGSGYCSFGDGNLELLHVFELRNLTGAPIIVTSANGTNLTKLSYRIGGGSFSDVTFPFTIVEGINMTILAHNDCQLSGTFGPGWSTYDPTNIRLNTATGYIIFPNLPWFPAWQDPG